MIGNNLRRKPKALFASKEADETPIPVLELESDSQEALWVAGEIRKILDTGVEPSAISVLYRTNAQSRNFEEALRRLSIPYKTVGGIAFYQRAEIKDMLAYLSILVNEKDDISFNRIVNYPKRGIGPAAISRLLEFAEFKGWSLYKTVKHVEEVATLTSAQKNKFRAFRSLMEKLQESLLSGSLQDTIESIYNETGYAEMVKSSSDQIRAKTIDENIGELVTAASEYDNLDLDSDTKLALFLENAALTSSSEESADEGEVSLMTLHSAKGLEFPVVFLTGLEENLFPSFQSINRNDIEEERRLCYVGITRAQDKLYLTYARSRRVFGQERFNDASTFVGELPEDVVAFYVQQHTGELLEQTLPQKRPRFTTLFESGSPPERKEDEGFNEGDIVVHKSYGQGTIIQKMEKYCKIAFRGKGIKKLDYNFIEKYDG